MLSEIFHKAKPILGTVRLLPLPGAPGWDGQWEALTTRAEQEATALATGGVDGLIIENSHDTPYSQGRVDVAGAVAMAMLARRIKKLTHLPVGFSVLQNDPETALALSINIEASFIRLSLLTGALVTESGVINSRLGELLHYRNRLKAEFPKILADLSVNHLVPATTSPGLSVMNEGNTLEHLIRMAKSLPGDLPDLALILSDKELQAEELVAFKDTTGYEVLIENTLGMTTAEQSLSQADGLILHADIRKTTALQPGTSPSVDMIRVEELVNLLKKVVPVSEMDPDIFLSR
jgi:hypothetical protein